MLGLEPESSRTACSAKGDIRGCDLDSLRVRREIWNEPQADYTPHNSDNTVNDLTH